MENTGLGCIVSACVCVCVCNGQMTSQLLEILVTHVERREITRLAALRAHKHATVVAALKVSLTLD